MAYPIISSDWAMPNPLPERENGLGWVTEDKLGWVTEDKSGWVTEDKDSVKSPKATQNHCRTKIWGPPISQKQVWTI